MQPAESWSVTIAGRARPQRTDLADWAGRPGAGTLVGIAILAHALGHACRLGDLTPAGASWMFGDLSEQLLDGCDADAAAMG
jgi:hypothetical protein